MLATDMTASGTPEEKLRQDFHLIFPSFFNEHTVQNPFFMSAKFIVTENQSKKSKVSFL